VTSSHSVDTVGTAVR